MDEPRKAHFDEVMPSSNAEPDIDPQHDDDQPDEQEGWSTWVKVFIGIVAALLVIALIIVGALFFYARSLQSNISEIENPFPEPAERPEKVVDDNTVNILILGSDSRLPTTKNGVLNQRGSRSDALMIAQLTGDRDGMNVMSIPRDSWVSIPGHGMGKINWAYSFGGAPLAIQTVENLTGIHIDHVVMADFNSFVELTDHLGGVDINSTTEGKRHYNGQQALKFVRERYNLPGGDFDRVRRQQAWMMAIADKAISKDVLTDPIALNKMLDTITNSIATDPDFTIYKMADLGGEMKDLSRDNINFLTAPNRGTGMVGDQSVVFLDEGAFAELSEAWVEDNVDDWLQANNDKVRTLKNEPVK